LIGSKMVALSEIQTVVSHPHVPGQCTRFLRDELADARVLAASSTADAVRQVAERGDRTWAAIGTRLAADIYGCEVLREDIEDRPDNQTRFVWLGRHGLTPTPLPLREGLLAGGVGKTSLVFWGPGSESSGWLVRCLDEFASRKINLTKIESRPRRERLGHYMFFTDLEGQTDDQAVADAVAGLEALCHEVRVLGSYTTT
jgi:prephenate dehydratase